MSTSAGCRSQFIRASVTPMLKIRIKREAAQRARAMERFKLVEASITQLGDEDLLDLADIFKDQAETPIAQCAFAEMARRNISL